MGGMPGEQEGEEVPDWKDHAGEECGWSGHGKMASGEPGE